MDKRVREVLALGRPGNETDRARTTVELGVKCADELDNSVFDSCHLLAGLYREGNGVAYHVLNNFDVTHSQIDNAIASREHTTAVTFQIDDDIRTVLDAAFAAADKLSHRYIGTEHLLIGVATDCTKSAKLLMDIGLSPNEVTDEVYALLGHGLP